MTTGCGKKSKTEKPISDKTELFKETVAEPTAAPETEPEVVEKLKKSVSKQEKINESLVMKLNELISLENMQLVAASEGLEYNNNNIIVIQK